MENNEANRIRRVLNAEEARRTYPNRVQQAEQAAQAPIQANRRVRRIQTQNNRNAFNRSQTARVRYPGEVRWAELIASERIDANNNARRANRAALHEHWLANSVEWPQGPADAPHNTFLPRVQAVRNIFRARHRAAVPQEVMQNAMPQEAMPQEAAELIRRPVNQGHAVALLEAAAAPVVEVPPPSAEQARRNYATRSAAAYTAYKAQLNQEAQAEQAAQQADREARHQLWQQQRPLWNPHKPLKNQMKDVLENHRARWQSQWELRRARKRAMNEASRNSKKARIVPFGLREIQERERKRVARRQKIAATRKRKAAMQKRSRTVSALQAQSANEDADNEDENEEDENEEDENEEDEKTNRYRKQPSRQGGAKRSSRRNNIHLTRNRRNTRKSKQTRRRHK